MSAHTVHRGTSAPALLRPASDVIVRQLGEGAVFIRMGTSRIYELNATGARIWHLLTQHADRRTVTNRLVEEFAIDPQAAEQAVDDLMAELRREGLV